MGLAGSYKSVSTKRNQRISSTVKMEAVVELKKMCAFQNVVREF
jgi:hypothetical protein